MPSFGSLFRHAGLIAYGAAVASVATPAYAYVDPAAGSMILQLLLGGSAGVWLLFKRLFRK